MKIENSELLTRITTGRQSFRLLLPFLFVGIAAAVLSGCIQFNWRESDEMEALAPATAAPAAVDTPTFSTTELPNTGGTPAPALSIPHTQPLAAEVISSTVNIPNPEELERFMLELVNEDRRENGLQPVEWDPLAAKAARAHAKEMAQYDYLSHWNLAGRGPDVRFALFGGQDAVLENVYAYWQRYANGTPAPVQDWRSLVATAQQELMNSPGHRETILDPGNTHVGIGMAYNPELGEFRLAQEFIHDYLDQEPLPETAQPGDVLEVRGRLLHGASDPLINLDYQPFPEPKTVAELGETEVYQSPAVFMMAEQPDVFEDQRYSADLTIPLNSSPGYYHVRIWVSVEGMEVLAGDTVVVVE